MGRRRGIMRGCHLHASIALLILTLAGCCYAQPPQNRNVSWGPIGRHCWGIVCASAITTGLPQQPGWGYTICVSLLPDHVHNLGAACMLLHTAPLLIQQQPLTLINHHNNEALLHNSQHTARY